jgi:hypothetical protein
MNPQEQQMIDSLFQRLAQAAPQAGPRDPEAEALIQQHFQTLPGAAYYMAQTLLMQERALQQAEARLAGGGGAAGSFMPPPPAYGQPYQQPSYQQPSYQPAYQQPPPYPYAPPQQQGGGMGGFLAGAGKIALGVGGGVLVADAVMGLGHELFGGGHQQQGFDLDDQYRDRDDGGFVQQQDFVQQQGDGGYVQQEDIVQQQQDDGGFGQQDDSSNDWGSGSDDGGSSSDW